jgi:hypothetical protein
MGAAVGRLPDEAMRRRMAQYVDALPAAQPVGPPQPPAPTHAVLLPAAVLDRYVGGTRWRPADPHRPPCRRGTGCAARRHAGGRPLHAVRDPLLGPQGPIIEFQLDGEGTVTGLILEQGGQRMTASGHPAERCRIDAGLAETCGLAEAGAKTDGQRDEQECRDDGAPAKQRRWRIAGSRCARRRHTHASGRDLEHPGDMSANTQVI